MPPPGGIAGIGVSFLGFSATIASVVINRPAMEAPSCSAMRTTLVGSMMPFFTKSPYSPALMAIWRAGHVIAFLTISTPCFWVFVFSLDPLDTEFLAPDAISEIRKQAQHEAVLSKTCHGSP